jgi:5-methylcytosine-specific restriction endonuclease McrA
MNILVLNADYQPLNVTTLQRGFNLVFTGKAEIIKYDEKPIITDKKNYKRPLVIRLMRYVSIPFKKVPLSRYNIFRRDGHACGYCGTNNNLTIDHVLPKSRGGGNSWENLVTCCKKCNAKKDNRTPKEAGMVLLVELRTPSYMEFITKINGLENFSLKSLFE